MGKISISIPDELESTLRRIAFERYEGKKGSLSTLVEEALGLWLKSQQYE